MLRRFQRSTPNAQRFNEEDFVARQPATQNVKGRRSVVRGYANLSRRLVTTKHCVGGSLGVGGSAVLYGWKMAGNL